METKTAKTTEAFFDQQSYDDHVTHLNGMLQYADHLGEVWRDQKILSETPFTTEHYHGIMENREDYIENVIYQMLKNEYEKLPGLTDHILKFERPKVNADFEKLERIVQFLKNPGPSAPLYCRFDMLEIKKSKAVIRPEAIKELREKFTTRQQEGEVGEILEKGKKAEELINDIYGYMLNKRQGKQDDLGFTAMPVKLDFFAKTRQPGQPWRSVFFKDQSGKIKFNARLV